MRPRQGAVEVSVPEAGTRVLPTALTSYKVRGVESASEDKEGVVTPKQYGIAAWNGEGMYELGHDGSTKTAIVRDSPQLTPDEQQK